MSEREWGQPVTAAARAAADAARNATRYDGDVVSGPDDTIDAAAALSAAARVLAFTGMSNALNPDFYGDETVSAAEAVQRASEALSLAEEEVLLAVAELRRVFEEDREHAAEWAAEHAAEHAAA